MEPLVLILWLDLLFIHRFLQFPFRSFIPGDSGYISGYSGSQNPEYPGSYPEYPGWSVSDIFVKCF